MAEEYVEVEEGDLYKVIDEHIYKLVWRDETSRLEWEHDRDRIRDEVKLVDGKFVVIESEQPTDCGCSRPRGSRNA